MEEVWKNIPGYDYYQVSDRGRARSLGRRVSDGSRRQGRMLKILRKKIGHAYHASITISWENKVRSFTVSRLVYELFIGPLNSNDSVIHLDGDNLNNEWTNLKRVPAFQQLSLASRKGSQLARKEQDKVNSKLNLEGMRRIYQMRKEGTAYDTIGKALGISATSARRAYMGLTYPKLSERVRQES